MSLRTKFIFYLICVHLLFASIAVYLLVKHRVWLLAVELIFVLSLFVGLRLVRGLFGTLELINTGAQFISDSDFTTRFCEIGQPEMDRLVNIYNKMIDHLREERIKLQEQHFFLEKIVVVSPSGIITLDFDATITLVNPAAQRMLQISEIELIGKKLCQLGTVFATELAKLKEGESKVLPLLGRRRVKCWKSHFLDRGFPRSFILMEELTDELRHSEKAAYEKLIRMMSHEVNNSIGAANSLLHSCLHYKDQLNDEDREDFENALNVVISRTDQLNSFMKSFADVVRLPPPRLLPCNLERLLEEITVLMRAQSADRNICLRMEIETPPGEVLLDRSQMELVLVNILKNSLEAIGENGTITIRVGHRDGRKFITIEDTGGGIPPEVQVNLFTPFFTTKDNGQGIGLTLVSEILDQHHFDFMLEGQLGKPTQFTIYF
ncbi:MAG: ATP-binding protein [Acidobacteriota bacterium]